MTNEAGEICSVKCAQLTVAGSEDGGRAPRAQECAWPSEMWERPSLLEPPGKNAALSTP